MMMRSCNFGDELRGGLVERCENIQDNLQEMLCCKCQRLRCYSSPASVR